MNTMWIKAVEGRLILMPDRGFAKVTEVPVEVERTPFYLKCIHDGDITECDADGNDVETVIEDEDQAFEEASERAFQLQQARQGVLRPLTRAEAKQKVEDEAKIAKAKADDRSLTVTSGAQAVKVSPEPVPAKPLVQPAPKADLPAPTVPPITP